MATVKDFWTGKTAAQLAATMATQERDFYRSPKSFGDHRRSREYWTGDFTRMPVTVGLSEADADASHARVDEFLRRVRAWQKDAKLGRIDLAETLSAMISFNDSGADVSERAMEFARTLGIRRNSGVKRIGTFNKHKETLQRIAREVWDIPV